MTAKTWYFSFIKAHVSGIPSKAAGEACFTTATTTIQVRSGHGTYHDRHGVSRMGIMRGWDERGGRYEEEDTTALPDVKLTIACISGSERAAHLDRRTATETKTGETATVNGWLTGCFYLH